MHRALRASLAVLCIVMLVSVHFGAYDPTPLAQAQSAGEALEDGFRPDRDARVHLLEGAIGGGL